MRNNLPTKVSIRLCCDIAKAKDLAAIVFSSLGVFFIVARLPIVPNHVVPKVLFPKGWEGDGVFNEDSEVLSLAYQCP